MQRSKPGINPNSATTAAEHDIDRLVAHTGGKKIGNAYYGECPHCGNLLTVGMIRTIWTRFVQSCRRVRSGGRHGGRPRNDGQPIRHHVVTP